MQIKMLICNQNSWTTNTNFYGFLLWFVSHPQKIGLYRNTSRYCSVTISCSPTIFANLSYCHFPQPESLLLLILPTYLLLLLLLCRHPDPGDGPIETGILISLPRAYCVTSTPIIRNTGCPPLSRCYPVNLATISARVGVTEEGHGFFCMISWLIVIIII